MASRLRKTFHYPSSDDEASDDADLDEEHQEALIASLQAQDSRNTSLYRKLFLAIPLAAALFYAFTFLSATSARQRLVSILAVSSLASTAYILHFQQLEKADRKGKRAVYAFEAAKGPVERYLVTLNAALAGLLVLASGVSYRQARGLDAIREVLPAVVFGMMMVIRELLRPVDVEVLEGARFELKGA